MDDEKSSGENLVKTLSLRAKDLEKEGFEPCYAWDKAYLQYKIEHWPDDWGEQLHVLIYGDFQPPRSDLNFQELSIFISKEPQKKTPIEVAQCVLKARVKVFERTLRGLTNAILRINILLGGLELVSWGNGGCGWWCSILHETIGSSQMNIEDTYLGEVVKDTLSFSKPLRQKIEAALYWIREPNSMVLEWHRNDVLRTFSAYWNAFECLVEAINIQKPGDKTSRSEKQQKIDDFLKDKEGHLTAADIEHCYRQVVNPGFVAKATHALEVCFGDGALLYVEECFHLEWKNDRLYNIRNAINHGDIDAEDPDELFRVNSRLRVLWFIIWRMFALFLTFPSPINCPGMKLQ